METKVCPKCGRELQLSDFYNDRRRHDGKGIYCKECCKKYRENSKEKIKEYNRKYSKEYYKNHKEKIKEYNKKYKKEYYENNKERLKEKTKEYRKNNKEKIKEYKKEYGKEYRKNNRERINEYERNKIKEDELFAVKKRCRRRIREFIKHRGHIKTSKTFEMIGCTPEQLLEHLHKTWYDNYGTEYNGEPVHIDHIIPLSSAKTEEDMYKLCHYTNLQYLKPEDNLSKSDRILQTI